MPRYMIERTFPDGLQIPLDSEGARICENVVRNNTADAVTWVESFVSTDRRTTYCVYDAPTPEAIRKTAERNGLPLDRITEVRVLTPYFYR